MVHMLSVRRHLPTDSRPKNVPSTAGLVRPPGVAFRPVYGEEGYAGDAKKLAAEQTGEKTVVAFKSERSPCLSRGTFYFS